MWTKCETSVLLCIMHGVMILQQPWTINSLEGVQLPVDFKGHFNSFIVSEHWL